MRDLIRKLLTYQPALGDIVHAGFQRRVNDSVARLTLRTDKEDVLALGGHVREELFGAQDALHGFADVDDVDQIALTEDVGLHLGIPPARTMAEVDSRIDQVLYQLRRQKTPPQATNFAIHPEQRRETARSPRNIRAKKPTPAGPCGTTTGSPASERCLTDPSWMEAIQEQKL